MTTARDYLAAVQQRADAATDGPWSRHDFGHAGEQEPSSIVVHTGKFDWDDLSGMYGDSETAIAWMSAWDSQEDADAEFIAAARTDVPRLVAALTAALDLADEYERDDREHLDRFGQHHPVAYHPYPRIRIAITAALTPKENDS